MSVTLEEFAGAFTSKPTDELYTQTKGATTDAIKAAKAAIKSLSDKNAKKTFTTTLEAVVKSVATADKARKKDRDKGFLALQEAAKQAQKLTTDIGKAKGDEVEKSLKGGADPSNDDLEILMNLPLESQDRRGAKNRLDELVGALQDSLKQKVFKMALETRFGVDVKTYKDKPDMYDDKEVSDATPNKSLQRIYEMLLKVPDSHSSGDRNKSLKEIIHTKEDYGGAAYNRKTKTIKMYVSRDELTGAGDVSAQLAEGSPRNKRYFPDGQVDPYKPVNTDKKTSYFDWATLHEVGHSVDDKARFMATHSGTAYGDWNSETPESIATVAAAKFKWDKAYIVAKLGNPDSDPVVPEEFMKKDASGDLKKAVDEWCTLVVSGKPWFRGANAKKIQAAVDGRVYQQAYPRDDAWWSYGYSERQKGVHGYQFRAPGEWFAELYAAYYSDKLQDAHPFVKDLKKLEAPTK